MPIIVSMVGVRCDRCQLELFVSTEAEATAAAWYINFAGSCNEGDAVVFCPKCRLEEAWILGHDTGR